MFSYYRVIKISFLETLLNWAIALPHKSCATLVHRSQSSRYIMETSTTIHTRTLALSEAPGDVLLVAVYRTVVMLVDVEEVFDGFLTLCFFILSDHT